MKEAIEDKVDIDPSLVQVLKDYVATAKTEDNNWDVINAKFPELQEFYTTEEGLIFDIAVVGLDKNHIKIEIDSNMLKILHEKDAEIDSDNKDYIHKGIARRAFNLGWKVSPKYNLKKIDAKMENGLLSILVPIEPDAKPVEIKIN